MSHKHSATWLLRHRLIDIGELPEDVQAALNAAVYCAGVAKSLVTIVQGPETKTTRHAVASMVRSLKNVRNDCRAAILAVIQELTTLRRGSPARFGQITEANAHKAALSFANMVLHTIKNPLDPSAPVDFEAIQKHLRSLDLPDAQAIIPACEWEASELANQRKAKRAEHDNRPSRESGLSAPFSPTELTRIFRCSYNTIIKRLREQTIPNIKVSQRSYQIQIDRLPQEVKERLQRKKQVSISISESQ